MAPAAPISTGTGTIRDFRQAQAKMDVASLGPNRPSLVTINGPIELGDKDQFLRKIGPLTRAIVAFNSDGGNLLAGIQIGEIIRLKNFASLVPDGMRCASSCALVRVRPGTSSGL